MIISRESNREVLFADGGLSEAVQFIQTTDRLWDYGSSKTNEPSRRWDLGVGYAGALELARDGWQEAMREFSVALKAIPALESVASHGYDVAGDVPDIPRYLAGDMRNMRSRRKAHGREPAVHLVCSNGYSGSVSADEMKMAGLALAFIVDALENSGRRVQLDVVLTARLPGGEGVVGWRVKRAEDSMDLGNLAFSLAHPAASRRLEFAMLERMTRKFQSPTYGSPTTISGEAKLIIDAADAFTVPAHPPTATGLTGAIAETIRLVNQAAGQALMEEI